MECIIIFIFGAIIGSFLNVCIYRIPLGKSIITPRSFCPFCKSTIRWYDNIPLISFIVLKGKCRDCSKTIPIRYFLVEFLTALSGVILLNHFSLGVHFFVYWLLICALIASAFIDLEKQEIPDVISIPGIFIGAILFTIFRLDNSGVYWKSFLNSFFGSLSGALTMFLLGFFGQLIFRKEALGGGDVKLMAMIGAFLGWRLVILTFFLAPIFGAGVALFMKIKFKSEIIPYGPYLSLAGVVSLLYGDKILKFIVGSS